MTLFGEAKFGEIKFGSSSITRPRFALEIDWDQDGFFDGRNDGLLMNSLRLKRGRRFVITPNGDAFEEDETGQLAATLVDKERWYDPNTNATIGGGRLFRLKVRTPEDQIFDLMAGTINEPIFVEERSVPKVQINGEDGWSLLRDQRSRVSIGLQEDLYGDEIMQLMLDTIGWPRIWPRGLAGGVDLHQYWWADNKSAAKALFDLAFSEMGQIWIAGDGGLTFRNRHFIDSSLFTITDADVFLGSLQTLQPWEVVRNSVRVTANPRELQTNVELWRSLDVIRLVAGEQYEKFVDFSYNNVTVPVTAITQPVAGVDFICNTNADGTGVDITSAFSVEVYPFSTTGKVTITNNGGVAGYILYPLKIRGNALSAQSTTSEFEDEASIRLFGKRSLDIDYEWIQNENAARAIARFLKTSLAYPKKHLKFQMISNPEKQFALDLGTQVDVDIVSKGISGTYRVYYLQHQWVDRGGLVTRTDVQLEPVDSRSDYWIVPKTIPMKVPF